MKILPWIRYLLLLAKPAELKAMDWRDYLGPALVSTWVVGMGRYWDHPSAGVPQMLGLGSVIYVLALAALLWILVLPLGAVNWSYPTVLMLVAMTSPPALLYAIPVERWMSLENAISANTWFLGIVASWRVAILVMLFRRVVFLTGRETLVCALLPLSAIVTTLAILNLENAVFEIMGGFRRVTPTPNDGAFGIVVLLTGLSYLAILPLLFSYIRLVLQRRSENRQFREGIRSPRES